MSSSRPSSRKNSLVGDGGDVLPVYNPFPKVVGAIEKLKARIQKGEVDTSKPTQFILPIPVSLGFTHSLSIDEVDYLISFTVRHLEGHAEKLLGELNKDFKLKVKLYFRFKEGTKAILLPEIRAKVDRAGRSEHCEWCDIDEYRNSDEWIDAKTRFDTLYNKNEAFKKMFDGQLRKDVTGYQAWLKNQLPENKEGIPEDTESLDAYFKMIAIDMIAFLPETENAISAYLYKQERFAFSMALAKYANELGMQQSFHFVHYETDKLVPAERSIREQKPQPLNLVLGDADERFPGSAPPSPKSGNSTRRHSFRDASYATSSNSDTSPTRSIVSSPEGSEAGSDDETDNQLDDDKATHEILMACFSEMVLQNPAHTAVLFAQYARMHEMRLAGVTVADMPRTADSRPNSNDSLPRVSSIGSLGLVAAMATSPRNSYHSRQPSQSSRAESASPVVREGSVSPAIRV